MISAADLTNRAEQLRADVADEKRAIRQHRRALGEKKAALAALEDECRRRGLGFRQQEQTHGTNRPHSAAN